MLSVARLRGAFFSVARLARRFASRPPTRQTTENHMQERTCWQQFTGGLNTTNGTASSFEGRESLAARANA
jgi:hypothetical protein